jgi:MFS family permease
MQAACEFGFSASQQSLLSSVVFAGMVLGAATWGLAADALGRRTTLLASCSVVVAAGLASAAAPGYAVSLRQFAARLCNFCCLLLVSVCALGLAADALEGVQH